MPFWDISFKAASTELGRWRWFSVTSVRCHSWVALAAREFLFLFPLFTQTFRPAWLHCRLHELPTRPSERRRYPQLRLCPAAHTSYSGTTPGAQLERHSCELISRARAAEVTVLSKEWVLEASACCFSLFMYANRARMRLRALLDKSACGRLTQFLTSVARTWNCSYTQTPGTQTCWYASETKLNCPKSLFCLKVWPRNSYEKWKCSQRGG